ncbi:EboA domain-containing protein [Maribacter sp. MMG018]|uniref:EboA domain-containing protein n=1 Tax=Maribacter sp. MMG018 TaxID=2822688 RepID=UPI001B37D10C|nr:EboA domain-containing protein [Maribacter sp. MMG018]MBQ4914532.1 EboA domain-containing protein [Maribacter sp. MMG018]
MQVSEQIKEAIGSQSNEDAILWLDEKTSKLETDKNVRDLYMSYSLLASKFDKNIPLKFEGEVSGALSYLDSHNANLLEAARIYLLAKVLEIDDGFYGPKVANIIQVADTTELETFLKFLVLLPEPETYKSTAVEALRTNISVIFDAITLNNPYPAKYFNDQQWNQMYLKAAFMERDLSQIQSVDERANADLARIISDYAHERWAASRKIDPMFWRPVSKFLNDTLLKDMQRLLGSEDVYENRAGVLCCYYSENKEALKLLEPYNNLKTEIETNKLTWNTLKK